MVNIEISKVEFEAEFKNKVLYYNTLVFKSNEFFITCFIMGSGFSRIKINHKTAYHSQNFTKEDYYALNDYLKQNNKYSMHEYYFRECMMPLIERNFDIPCYYFLYGTGGCEYIAKRRPGENLIQVKAVHYMDDTRRKKFIEGYARLTNLQTCF